MRPAGVPCERDRYVGCETVGVVHGEQVFVGDGLTGFWNRFELSLDDVGSLAKHFRIALLFKSETRRLASGWRAWAANVRTIVKSLERGIIPKKEDEEEEGEEEEGKQDANSEDKDEDRWHLSGSDEMNNALNGEDDDKARALIVETAPTNY